MDREPEATLVRFSFDRARDLERNEDIKLSIRLQAVMNGRSAEDFLHLVVGENTAACVREGLRLVGRDEDTEYFSDDLTVGPIHDVDRGAASRAAWWRRVDGNKVWQKPRVLGDVPIWKRIVDDKRKVVLWYGPHPLEHIYALRACWYLRRSPARIYEVSLPPHSNPRLPAFYGAAGIVGPRGVSAAWPSLRPVRNAERHAAHWVELRKQRGEGFRELRRSRIIERPIDAHDVDFIAACAGGWTSSTLVIARVLSQVPTGDAVLSWRLRQLLASAALEGRGRRTRYGLPNEIRAAAEKAHPPRAKRSASASR